jgi:hypothetical protein
MRFKTFTGDTVGRAALALIRAHGDRPEAIRLAQVEPSWGDSPAEFLKAAVGPGKITDPTWGGPLVPVGAAQFIELVERQSLIGRIPGFIPAPPNAALVEVTSYGNASWVGESFPKPATAPGLNKLGTLAPYKVTSLAVATAEVVRVGGVAGEQLFTSMLSTACGSAIDMAFCDPANAGIPDVKPAYVGAGGTLIPSTGDLLTDLASALASITNPSAAVLILNSVDAAKAAAARLPNGALANPDISARGGTLGGLPAYTSDSAPAGDVLVLNPSRVFLWQGGLSLTYSDQALIQMDSDPDNPATSSTVQVSLWAANLHGILVEVAVSWMPAAGAAAVITDAFASVSP